MFHENPFDPLGSDDESDGYDYDDGYGEERAMADINEDFKYFYFHLVLFARDPFILLDYVSEMTGIKYGSMDGGLGRVHTWVSVSGSVLPGEGDLDCIYVTKGTLRFLARYMRSMALCSLFTLCVMLGGEDAHHSHYLSWALDLIIEFYPSRDWDWDELPSRTAEEALYYVHSYEHDEMVEEMNEMFAKAFANLRHS